MDYINPLFAYSNMLRAHIRSIYNNIFVFSQRFFLFIPGYAHRDSRRKTIPRNTKSNLLSSYSSIIIG